ILRMGRGKLTLTGREACEVVFSQLVAPCAPQKARGLEHHFSSRRGKSTPHSRDLTECGNRLGQLKSRILRQSLGQRAFDESGCADDQSNTKPLGLQKLHRSVVGRETRLLKGDLRLERNQTDLRQSNAFIAFVHHPYLGRFPGLW